MIQCKLFFFVVFFFCIVTPIVGTGEKYKQESHHVTVIFFVHGFLNLVRPLQLNRG